MKKLNLKQWIKKCLACGRSRPWICDQLTHSGYRNGDGGPLAVKDINRFLSGAGRIQPLTPENRVSQGRDGGESKNRIWPEKRKKQVQINLYKVFNVYENGDRFNLRFVQTYWVDSILSVTKNNICDIDFVEFVPFVDNLPLGHPNEVIAFTKSDVYLFSEIKNNTKHDKRVSLLVIELYLTYIKLRDEQQRGKRELLEKNRLRLLEFGISANFIESMLPEEKKVITSSQSLQHEDKDLQSVIP